VVASTKGQGGADLSQLAGLTVPVRLTGPFDAMKYQVDYSAVATQVVKSKAGERIRGGARGALGHLEACGGRQAAS